MNQKCLGHSRPVTARQFQRLSTTDIFALLS